MKSRLSGVILSTADKALHWLKIYLDSMYKTIRLPSSDPDQPIKYGDFNVQDLLLLATAVRLILVYSCEIVLTGSCSLKVRVLEIRSSFQVRSECHPCSLGRC